MAPVEFGKQKLTALQFDIMDDWDVKTNIITTNIFTSNNKK